MCWLVPNLVVWYSPLIFLTKSPLRKGAFLLATLDPFVPGKPGHETSGLFGGKGATPLSRLVERRRRALLIGLSHVFRAITHSEVHEIFVPSAARIIDAFVIIGKAILNCVEFHWFEGHDILQMPYYSLC